MKIIPAIDLKDGKCVRLFKGDFDKTTEYSDNPAAVGQRFSLLDVEMLHIVDLDGARSGAQANHAIVQEIASASNLSVQLGGGIRSRQDIQRWLDAGVDRCVIGSIAIESVDEVCDWLREFSAARIVLALDVKLDGDGLPQLTTHGWTASSGKTLWNCLERYAAEGARHILCTDVARDGAMAGPNFALYEDIMNRYPDLELQASGGVRHIDDLRQLRNIGVPAAITGRALLDGKISESEVTAFRQSV